MDPTLLRGTHASRLGRLEAKGAEQIRGLGHGTRSGRGVGDDTAQLGLQVGSARPRLETPRGARGGARAACPAGARSSPPGTQTTHPPAHKARLASSALGSSGLCRCAPPAASRLGARPGQAAGVERRSASNRRGRERKGRSGPRGGGGGGVGWRKRPRAEEGAIEFQTQTTARARPGAERSRAFAHRARPVRSGERAQTPWRLRSSRRGPPSRRGPREGRSAAAPQPPHAQTWARASRLGAEPGAPAAPPCRDPTGRRSTNAGTWCSPR